MSKEYIIKYIEEKIKHLDKLMNDKKIKPYGEELRLYQHSKSIYEDLLYIMRSGKYE